MKPRCTNIRLFACVLWIFILLTANAEAQTVKITPLGSHSGEFCRNDRAILFEDPTGVRVLYDPGRTVDETDARLGTIHAVLLSSVHVDHSGDTKPNPAAPGTCGTPGTLSALPNSNVVNIAAAKNAAVLTGGEMGEFIGRKIQTARGGVATPGCPTLGLTNEMVVPLSAPCTATLRPGGNRTVRAVTVNSGVRVANIPAYHSNGIPAALIEAPSVAPGTTGYGGNDGGFFVQFTNGLRVYLTADTGLSADMEVVVRRFYQPSLVVINMGDVFSMGPEEAVFAIRDLIKPQTVIPSHINEAATSGGVAVAGSRLELFLQGMRNSPVQGFRREPEIDVVLPLSGVTRQFDGNGRCVDCQ
jgi:Beta-lactamase superfamily domain